MGNVRGALDLLYSLHSGEAAEPFPLPIVEELGRLVGAHAAGYSESPRCGSGSRREVVARSIERPPWLDAALDAYAHQDPTHFARHATASEPIAISDLASRREFMQTDLYDTVCRPLGVEDSIRLYLPPTEQTARFFFFDRDRRGFGASKRTLLSALRPHLALWRARFGDRQKLTPRETEVMRELATGASNTEIARRLYLSPHTVRKHLENIYAKLGVRTRTEATAEVVLWPDRR